ncbi:MAG: TatD family hydrolase, partial [bacterium]|nr:TatD family hydrolase [bacterium]
GADAESSKKAIEIAEKYEGVFASVGVHPDSIFENFDETIFRDLIKHPKTVAIGECGLDWHANNEREKQKELFVKQVELAIELDKPLMIHCRDAHTEVTKIFKNYKMQFGDKLRGDIHFFTGSIKEAEEYMDLGFSFSFTGVITFTDSYNEVIKFLPLEKIMIETDAPFVAPVLYRGKRCEPLYAREVAKRIAELKLIDYDKVAAVTTANAVKLFNLPM